LLIDAEMGVNTVSLLSIGELTTAGYIRCAADIGRTSTVDIGAAINRLGVKRSGGISRRLLATDLLLGFFFPALFS